MSQKAVELLKEAAKLLKTEAFMECTAAESCEGYVGQAIALLEQPVCESCGGSKKVPISCTHNLDRPSYIPLCRWNAFEEGGFVKDLYEACKEALSYSTDSEFWARAVVPKLEQALAKYEAEKKQ